MTETIERVVKKYERVIKNEKIEGTPYSYFSDIIREICGDSVQKIGFER